MRRCLFAVVPVWLPLLIVGLGAAPVVAAEVGERTPLRLVGASSNNFPPVNILDAQGELTGFGRELANAVVEAAGGTVRHIHSAIWTEVLGWLDDGTADFIHDTGYTPDRVSYLDYSEPILQMPEAIFVLSERFDIHSLESLFAKRVACVNQHITHLYLKKIPGIDCVIVKTPADAVRALLDGKVDALIYPRQIVLYYAYRLDARDRIKTVGEPLRTLTWHMVVKKGNADVLLLLNRGIAKVKASGALDRIYDKWFGQALAEGYSARDVAWIIGAVVALAALFLALTYGWVRILRRTVDARTKDLRESQERYRRVVDLAPDAIIVHDGARLVFANDAAARMHGAASPNDLLGRHWLELIHPDEHDGAIRRNREFMAARTPAEFIRRRRLRLDGTELTVETAAAPITWDGKPAVLGMFRDITERLRAEKALSESERRFHDFADSASDWFWEIDAEGRFTWFSVDRHPMTGDPTSELIGKRPGRTRMVDPESAAELQALFADSLARRVPFRGVRSRVKSSDGTMFDLSISGVPVFDDSGAFRGIRGSSNDVTAQVRAEDQLRQAQKMEAVGQLTGGIAHDFNNILSVVLGNLELMARLLPEDGDDDRASPRALNDNAVRATTRGAQLSHRLLAFARKQPLDPREIDVGEVVDGMHDMIRRTVSENIDIRIERRDGAPAYADPSQLENALLNLVINARDALPDGGSLTIETADAIIAPGDPETADGIAPGAYVAVSVSDTGTGIPEEVRARVFEPFFTTKEVGAGSGLGLSMVHGFARQSGGTVDIRSSPGHGTSVRILLPTTAPAGARPDAGEPGPAEFELDGKGEVILLVEDDAPVRDSTQAILEALGYVVLAAEDGPSAIATLKRSRDIDLLLTDMVMPGGLTGAMLARQARAERPDLKVVFVSGYVRAATLPEIADSTGADSTGADSTGADSNDIEFIRKPFTIDTLARELRRALNG